MMAWFFFVLGLVVGSFLNCLIYRLETGQGFIFGRSFCLKCQHQLSWFDLIPVLSFVFLNGRCRYCQKPISWQYPLVELATAFLFVLAAGGSPILFIYKAAIISLLVVVFVYDLRHYLIPDEIVYSGIAVVLFYRGFEALRSVNVWNLAPLANESPFGRLGYALLAALLASGFFWLVYYFSRGRALGFGDVKLAFLMGLFLGFPGILVALFFSFFSGAIIGTALMLLKRKTLKSELPFGPFLVSGVFFAMFWGEAIINRYLSLWQ